VGEGESGGYEQEEEEEEEEGEEFPIIPPAWRVAAE